MSGECSSPPAEFLSQLSEELRQGAAALEGLERRLDTLLETARAAWPQIALPPSAFVGWVARHLSADEGIEEQLARLCVADLYLACACGRGDPVALECFERQLFWEVDTALHYMRAAPETIEEVKQELRLMLFVEQPGRAAKIVQYSGRGALRHWLHMVAVRQARRMMRRAGKETPSDEALLDLAAPSADPALAPLKTLYRAEFKEAFGHALASLGNRDRNVLRYHYLERLNIEKIGAIYGVHRATVARWLVKIKDALLAATRREMMARLQLPRQDFDSVMKFIESGLEISIGRHLAPDRDASR